MPWAGKPDAQTHLRGHLQAVVTQMVTPRLYVERHTIPQDEASGTRLGHHQSHKCPYGGGCAATAAEWEEACACESARDGDGSGDAACEMCVFI